MTNAAVRATNRVLIAAACIIGSVGPARSQSLPDAPAPPAAAAVEPEDPSAGYVLSLPLAISDLEVNRYASLLNLSDEQFAALRSFWLAYCAEWQEVDRADRAKVCRWLSASMFPAGLTR